jgi:hypothetical protein
MSHQNIELSCYSHTDILKKQYRAATAGAAFAASEQTP